MAKQVLLYGTVANDGTGENLRAAAVKINQNFDEVYAADVQHDADIAAVSAAKEPVLGNPDVSGKVLASTAAGVRSWVTAAAGGTTNLDQGTRTATTVPITSSTGASAVLAAATTSLAGVMTAADKGKVDDLLAERTVAGALVFPAKYPVSWTYNASGTLNVGTATDGVTTWTMTFAYNGAGNVATMTAYNGVTTWVNTPTYVNGLLTTTSGWIQQ